MAGLGFRVQDQPYLKRTPFFRQEWLPAATTNSYGKDAIKPLGD